MNIPNTLTIIRFLLVPVFASFMLDDHFIRALCVLFVAGLTDVLDGYIARKYNLITRFGKLMDPLADKIMIVTALFCLYTLKYVPMWIFLVVLIKEICMLLGAARLYKKNIVVSSNYIGKAATVIFYFAIVLSILMPKSTLSIALFSGAVIATIAAMIKYAHHYFVTYTIKDKDLR